MSLIRIRTGTSSAHRGCGAHVPWCPHKTRIHHRFDQHDCFVMMQAHDVYHVNVPGCTNHSRDSTSHSHGGLHDVFTFEGLETQLNSGFSSDHHISYNPGSAMSCPYCNSCPCLWDRHRHSLLSDGQEMQFRGCSNKQIRYALYRQYTHLVHGVLGIGFGGSYQHVPKAAFAATSRRQPTRVTIPGRQVILVSKICEYLVSR